MFKFKQVKPEVKAETPEPKVVEKIVVIGDSVRTLYSSTSRRMKERPYASAYGGLTYTMSKEEKEYHGKYWTDPRIPFAIGGKDVTVTQVQGVIADNGKVYLLDVAKLIKVEE